MLTEERDNLPHESKVNFIALATQFKNWIMTGTDHTLRIFECEEKTGKNKLVGEFKDESATITTAHFCYANKHVMVGYDNGQVKCFKLEMDGSKVKGFKEHQTFKGISSPIVAVSTSSDLDILAICGKEEKACKIYDFQTGAHVRNLTFSEGPDAPNLIFRGCIFSHDRRHLFTMMCDEGTKTWASKWEAKDGEFDDHTTIQLHTGPCSILKISNDFYLAAGSDDGWIKSVNNRYFEVDRDDQQTESTITDIAFTDDNRFMMMLCADNSYKFVPNIRAPGMVRTIFQFLMLGFMLAYAYYKIKESFF